MSKVFSIHNPRPNRMHHDFETFSEKNIKKCGASRYARHSSTEVLMLGYAFDDGSVKQWVPEEGQSMPAEVEDAVQDDRILKYAWNKTFEWNIWKHVLGIDTLHSAWRDPMVMALSMSLPGALLKAGQALRVDEKYLKKDGHRLINWFSKPRPATKTLPVRRVYWYQKPDKWKEYLEYNRADVLAERKIYKLLRKYDLPAAEWKLWELDQEINERGIPLNMEMCNNIISIRDELISDRLEEMKEITGLVNPNSVGLLLTWLRENGYPYEDMKAGHVRRALKTANGDGEEGDDYEITEKGKRVLELRSEVSRTSVKKFDAIKNHVNEDDRLRNSFQFAGAARTWRWAGRVLQPQNLAKPSRGLDGVEWGKTKAGNTYVSGGTQVEAAEMLTTLGPEGVEMLFEKPIDALSGAVRTVIQAPKGHTLVDADLSAIENVVLGWCAQDDKILGVFRDGRDPYIDFATYLYKSTYDELYAEFKAGNKKKRTLSKPGVLGCGYLLGPGKQYENKRTGEIEATGLLGYAWGMGIKLTPEEAERSVRTWRQTYRKAVSFWYDMERAVFATVRTGKPHKCWPVSFDMKGPVLRMNLPSGRSLHYIRPRLEEVKAPWGDYKTALTYEGLNSSYQWTRIDTHPGKLTENCVQAIARDLLASGMVRADKAGLPIVMHIHDQIVAMSREEEADRDLNKLIECMTTLPKWAGDMPVSAAGHISKMFIKD